MRIELLWFLALLVALVGANGKRNFNYESYTTFPGTPETWSKSQWGYSAPLQANYNSSGLGANSNGVLYNGYGQGQSWSDAGTGADSILYNGGRWQGSGGQFGGYGAGLLGGGVGVTQKTSTGKKILQGSGLRFGLDESDYSGISQDRANGGRALFVEGAPYNKLSRNGFSTISRDVFGVYPGSSYSDSGSYGSYGRGTRWNAGSLFAPAGVKPMYGGISSIYGQNQISSGSAQLSGPILAGGSNLYSDSKWSNRGVYAGYGDGLDYYWRWRKNGFQPLDAAPVGAYGGYQSGAWNKYGGLQGSGLSGAGTGSGLAFGNNAFSTKGPLFGLGSGTSGIGLLNSANKFSGNLGASSGIAGGAINSGTPGFGSGLSTPGFGSGLAAGSGTGSYIYSKFNAGTAPLSTSNIFNVYGTKVSDLAIPAVGSSHLGTYVTGKYQNRPYSTVGVHPMYTQSKWTADNRGKQTGYYNGYGYNSGAYYRPSSYRPGYTATLTGVTPAFPQSGFNQYNSAKFPSTTGIIGTSGFSSNLYNDGKWSNRGVYSGYGDGLDYYWKWRKNGFQGADGRPTGAYIGSTGSYSNVYDGSYGSNIGNKNTGFGSIGAGIAGTGISGSGSSLAISPLLGSNIAPGYGTLTSFGSSRPAAGSVGYVTGQYTQTSGKPLAGAAGFGLTSGFGSVGSLNSASRFGGPSSAFGSVTTGAGQSSFGSGLAAGSGPESYISSGTKLSGLTSPAIGSSLLGTYVTGKYQSRPYSTVGVYPMYTQSKWTTDNSGKQSGYYNGYGYNSGAYYRPSSYRPGYTATVTGVTPAFPQSGFNQYNSAKFPSTTGIIGTSGFSSNLYNDGKWNNRGVYSGYGDGLDYYWKWRKNGFQGADGRPTGAYIGSTGSYSNAYDGSYGSNIGNKNTGFGSTGAGIAGTGISGSSSSLAISPLLGSAIAPGYGTLTNFGSSRPAAGSAGYVTGQYTQTTGKPLVGAGGVGLASGFGSIGSLNSASRFGGASSTFGSVTTGAGQPSFGSGLAAGSGTGSYISSGTKLSGLTSPAIGSSLLGTYVTGKYQNRPYSTVGVYPMYTQSKWTTDNSGKQSGYYNGYGYNSGAYYRPSSYRPGYTATLTGITPAFAQSGFTQFNAAKFPSTTGIIGSSGFSSNLYNGGKWNNRGVYSGYGDGLDYYWNWRKNGFKGASGRPGGTYIGSYDGSYSTDIGNKYTGFGASGVGSVGAGFSGSGSSLAFAPLLGSSVASGYQIGNKPSGSYFGSSRPSSTTTTFGVPVASSLSSGYLASGNRYQSTGITPMYSQSQWSLGNGNYGGYGKYSGSKYSSTSYRPGYVSTLAGINPNYSGSKYTSAQSNLAQLTPASFPSTVGTIGSAGFASNLYNDGKWNNGGSYYGYGKGLDSYWGRQKFGFQGAGSALTGPYGGYKGTFNNNYGALSQPLAGLASGGQTLSSPSGIGLSGSHLAGSVVPATYPSAPASVTYLSQLNSVAAPSSASALSTPSIASLVNSGLLSGTSDATGASILGTYIPSRYENRPYSTAGITPMYSQGKWTAGGHGFGSGYYTGYGGNSGASYSAIKNNPYYSRPQYSGFYQGATSSATFPGRGLNLYGGANWNNNGVYTGYAKNPSAFWNRIGGGFSSQSPFATSTSYKGNYLNNYNANTAGSNQGQYIASLNLPGTIGSANNLNLAGSWSNQPNAFGFNSMYSGNKWLINNGGRNTGVYYGYGSQGRYPSKVQTIYSGSIPNAFASGSTYQSPGNQAGLYNNGDWRYNGVYSGYGSGLDSYWRWRKSGFVGSGGKGSSAYTNSILGNSQGSAYGGQISQGGAGLTGFGNSWSTGGSWSGSPAGSTVKISQWSSPTTWQGSGLSTNTFKLRSHGW